MELTEKQKELFHRFDELVDLMVDNGFELSYTFDKPECLSYNPKFTIDGDKLIKCDNAYGDIIVPSGVREIVDGVFEGTNIASVKLPTVEIIGEGAFRNCAGLQEIKFSDRLKTIGDGAFEGCSRLYLVDLSQTAVDVLPDAVFRGCKRLNFVHFPQHLREIGNNAFEDCEEMLELILPGSVRRVGTEAFAACRKLARVVIPENIEELEFDSFAFYTHNPDYMLLPKKYEPKDEEDVSGHAFGYEYMYIDNLIHFYGDVPDWDSIYNA